MDGESRVSPAATLAFQRAAAAARRLLAFDETWFLSDGEGPTSALVFSAGDGTPAENPLVSGDEALARELGRRGLVSRLVVPVSGPDGRVRGHLGFGSKSIAPFRPEDDAAAEAVAALFAALLDEQERADTESAARRHAEIISALLPVVASTLDIREVFREIFEITQSVLGHDSMAIQLIRPGSDSIGLYVVSDDAPSWHSDIPVSRDLYEHDLHDGISRDVSFQGEGDSRRAVLEDVVFPDAPDAGQPVRVVLDENRTRLIVERGFRSFLRVVVQRGGGKIGSLDFASRRPAAFRLEQLPIARRIADHVSLALAHRRLADEAEQAAEARARAALLEERVRELVQQAEEREGFHRCIGESEPWKQVLKHATRVASTDTTVLLTGESGTGKEVVARFIHGASPRSRGPLIAVNCAALPEQLLESELFGYERGAFSGALTAKPGRIEQAARGVLFLDEVGEMSMALQAKLLRVIQEREFQRLGGTRTLKADVRLIAATNRDLQAAMRRNEFREDLYYRLRVFEIVLPPLRKRREDVLLLAEDFLAQFERTMGHRTAGLSREAREVLLAYEWPGNIRELRNALERAVILCDGGLITNEQLHLGSAEPQPETAADARFSGGVNVEAHEKRLIEEALKRARNNKSKAARLLGLSRTQLYARLHKYGLEEPSA
jgi:transcriptional regulator with GAF, ATPase, and Fis domain